MHLADTFIQIHLNSIKCIDFNSSYFPLIEHTTLVLLAICTNQHRDGRENNVDKKWKTHAHQKHMKQHKNDNNYKIHYLDCFQDSK